MWRCPVLDYLSDLCARSPRGTAVITLSAAYFSSHTWASVERVFGSPHQARPEWGTRYPYAAIASRRAAVLAA